MSSNEEGNGKSRRAREPVPDGSGIGLDRVNAPTFSQVLVFMPIPDGNGDTRTVIVQGELAWRWLGGSGIRFCEALPAEVLDFLAA